MRRGRIYPAFVGVIVILGIVAVAAFTRTAAREPADPDPLAARLQSLLALQEDGYRALLPPGERSLWQIVEAAHALSLLDRLDEAHLAQAIDELSASWSPALDAYLIDDDPADYHGDRESYQYDLLALNVRIVEFATRAGAPALLRDLPTPDLTGLIGELGDELDEPASILTARATRLTGGRPDAATADLCRQLARRVEQSQIEQAADIAVGLPTGRDCAADLEPLRGDLTALEDGITSRILREQRYTFDDILDLDQLRGLAEAAGRADVPADSVRVARMLLQHLDDEAREFGPATEPWTVLVLGRLLAGEDSPPLEFLTRRLESLMDFRGSLATSASADWYSVTLMAHLMVRSGALAADQAAELLGHPSVVHPSVDGLDWGYAFVGLRSPSTAELRLPREVLAVDDNGGSGELLIRALYADDSGSCAEAPDAADFLAVSPPSRLAELPPDEQLAYLAGLSRSARCSAGLRELLAQLAGQVRPPTAAPAPVVLGSIYSYWLVAETVCLASGSVSLDSAVVATLDSYLSAISHGPVRQSFDFLDLYASLRLLDLHRQGTCDGAWWEGLG
jgi:hypothetical protein